MALVWSPWDISRRASSQRAAAPPVWPGSASTAARRSLASPQCRVWLMESAADPPRAAATLRAEIRRHADGVTPFGYLSEVFVEPELRRRGIMRTLVDRAREFCAASGAAELRLETQLGHGEAEEFWRHLGFLPYRTLWRRGV